MFKKIFLTAALVLAFMFEAKAFVAQSVSDALSYRNVASGSARSKSKSKNIVRKTPETTSQVRTVDLQNAFSQNVSAGENDSLVVILEEDSGYYWRTSYDKSALTMTGNSASDGVRKIKFSPVNTGTTSVFFDYVNADGDIVMNKAAYIRVD